MSPALGTKLLPSARAGFAAAGERGQVTERWVRFGGQPVRLCFVGDELASALFRPLAHLETGPADGPALTVHAWSGSEAPVGLELPEAAARVRLADFTEEHCVMAWPAERLMMGYDRQAHEAWWWVPDVAVTPMFEQAMPFRPLLHWWGHDAGLQMVHAGAVGTMAGGAVLLGGASGSGKSTTSLFALTSADLRFLGDDYVLVGGGDRPEVFSIYSTAKIHEPDQERVPHVAAQVVGRQEEDKLVAFLGDQFADHLVERMPLRAVLLPRLAAEGPAVAPIGAFEALRRLGPSTVLQFPGPGHADALAPLAALVRSVPCFDFPLGPDPAATSGAIVAALDALSSGLPAAGPQ